MSLAIQAGMSLSEFYEAELWEVSVIVDGFMKHNFSLYKTSWEQTRDILHGFTGKRSELPWEGKDKEVMTEERWKRTRANFKKWEKNYQDELKRKSNGS